LKEGLRKKLKKKSRNQHIEKGRSVKVLVVGCGSIGRRHIKNLAGLGVSDFVLCDPNEEALKRAATGLEAPELYGDFNKAIEASSDAAIICTPSNMHLDMSMALAERGVHLFIEKPLSHTMEGVKELAELVKEKAVVTMMGMCYRFHPMFLRLKKMLEEESLGTLFHINYYGGHYLPDWHPEADYREEYAARSELGGGVILTSIHGLDNIRWLFGEVHRFRSYVDMVGSLDLDVEDMALAIMRLESGHYVTWQTDFLQRAPQHRMVIVGEKGTIRCDFIDGTIETYLAENSKWHTEKIEYEINTMYVSEMRHFLECIESGVMSKIDIADGIKTLELALTIKQDGNLSRKAGELCIVE
jgi:predicted dehydrogenase